MNAALQRRVQRYGWDKAAICYEQYWAAQLAPAQARMLHLAELKPGERALDVACGTGLVTFPAAGAVGPTGTVVGTDISERMVEQLRAEAGRRGLAQVQAERMDAERLELADAAFDVALCSLGLMYVPDPLAALIEMHRVLVPGGRAVAVVWGERRRCGWAEIFPIVDHRVESDVCPLFFQLGTGDTLKRRFEQAGFTEVVEERLMAPMAYDSAVEALGAAFAGGPVALAYSRFDRRTRDEAHAEYLASIEPYRNGAGYSIPGEFVVTRGLKTGPEG
jgi:ubiquinone/menaquinone biosynthesis C-methylase UbiE